MQKRGFNQYGSAPSVSIGADDTSVTLPVLDRTWLEINLDHLAANVRSIKQLLLPGVEMFGVVKADAYGHGVVEVAETMLANGVSRLAVSLLDEGIELRRHGIRAPILLLSYVDPRRAGEILAYDLTQAAYSWELLHALNEAGKKYGKRASVHIKLDTGMGRIGFSAGYHSLAEIRKMMQLPFVAIDGIFTHFATADAEDKTYLQQQFATFASLCRELEREGLHIPLKHCCNSAATLRCPEYHLDLVRPGLLYYGLLPDACEDFTTSFRPILSLKSRAIHVKEVEVGATISYGRRFKAERPTRVITVPLGYADGYPRAMSGQAKALIRGYEVPQIGNICMDGCMFDVTDLPFAVSVGEEVTLLGSSLCEETGEVKCIRAEDLAAWAGTISYEIISAMGKRVPRAYFKNGQLWRVNKTILPE